MKRCPQCEFVYEDDTNACEMDGSLLLHCSQILPPLESIGGHSAAGPPGRSWSQWRTIAFPTLAAAILMAVLFVTYYVVAQRSPNSQPTRSGGEEIAVAPAAPGDIPSASTSAAAGATSESTIGGHVTSPSATDQSLVPARLNAGPVSAAGGTGRGPVIIRFADGRSIKADEAWEKKEGIWYRQGGVVTFLKRGSAKIIAVPAAAARTTPAKPLARKPVTQPQKPKEESKIGSILKKTGRILKRPFKL